MAGVWGLSTQKYVYGLPVWSGGEGLSAVSYISENQGEDQLRLHGEFGSVRFDVQNARNRNKTVASKFSDIGDYGTVCCALTAPRNRTARSFLGLLMARIKRPSHVPLRHLPHTPRLYTLSRLSAGLFVAPIFCVSTLPMHDAVPVLLAESWLEVTKP